MTAQKSLFLLSTPRIYLIRMVIFFILAAFLVLILHEQIERAFRANPGLNALIFFVLFVGIVLALRQVIQLFGEVNWVNAQQQGEIYNGRSPHLLAPMATLLAQREGADISTQMLRVILDSVGARLDEARDTSRYLTGLLIFLGLLGTFWGLLETVASIGNVIGSMQAGGDATLMFDDLKNGLKAPISGMSVSFTSSLFGLAGSLVLGFLDLQAGQAQNRFYNELEECLSERTFEHPIEALSAGVAPEMAEMLTRITQSVDAMRGRGSDNAIANLAEGVQGLVQHMRSEQQMIRDWVEAQAGQQRDIKMVLDKLSRALDQR